MVNFTNFQGQDRKDFAKMVNGLNVLVAIALHEESRDVFNEIVQDVQQKTGIPIEHLKKCVKSTIIMIGAMNEDIVASEKFGFYIDEENSNKMIEFD